MTLTIYTIGHSRHSIEHFIELLAQHRVTAVADVRSTPASQYSPHFNRASLKRSLREAGIEYVFLGRELGARSTDPDCYVDGQVQYRRLAQTPEFKDGIRRLRNGMETERIALLCAEQEPLDCHRTVLVSRELAELGVEVQHIHGEGRLERHDDAMLRLRTGLGLGQPDLFHSSEELLDEALARQEKRIAYVDPDKALSR